MFIENTSIKNIIRGTGIFFLKGVWSILSKKRYLILTPQYFCTQLAFDRHNKKFIKVKLNNAIDVATFIQIYGSEDYGIEKLNRFHELRNCYDLIKNRGIPLIMDCGGNIGLASKYFAENYPEGKIVCIEPEKENIKQAKINNLNLNVDFIEAAVGAENSFGEIINPGLGGNAFRISLASGGATKVFSINHLLNIYSDAYIPFIIKIDIEGFESILFSKNFDWIKKFPILIIELHDWMLPKSGSSTSFLRAISSFDRDFIYIGENIFSISNESFFNDSAIE